jgi:hypothetical protein
MRLRRKSRASAFSAPQMKESGDRLIYANHDYRPTQAAAQIPRP